MKYLTGKPLDISSNIKWGDATETYFSVQDGYNNLIESKRLSVNFTKAIDIGIGHLILQISKNQIQILSNNLFLN
jgi:hypothetical protein